jgi:hypothetical protein
VIANVKGDDQPLTGVAGRRLVDTILRPVHEKVSWKVRRAASAECFFPNGLRPDDTWSATGGVLETALADFHEFFEIQGLSVEGGLPCRLQLVEKFATEEHEVRVSSSGVTIAAGDLEGARRALYWIEDEMLKRGGPFLPKGKHRRKAVIKTRISRCFFGPINRPPANRDELLDEVDYYPDAYLNRLAHDGVNALWITLKFRDTVPSKLFPGFAPESEKRLAKLRRTVEQCSRFGIRVFVFCIEPDSLPSDSPVFVSHPELKGHVIDDRAAFCTSTRLGKRYLTEATRTLFKSVPGLGGMIVIPVGERFTHCYSIALPESGTTEELCNCPRCSLRLPEDVLQDTLGALHQGMTSVNPNAELIAWPYGQLVMWGEAMTVKAAGRLPDGVVLQHNFESGGSVRQIGKDRPLWDYWLSVVGPSPAFKKAARSARATGNRVSAKLQVGCSHEDATVPFVPVPGLLHSKYSLMHQLGVSSVMQSWYFGNYPALMTRAAGALSFAPLIKSEAAFLKDLALRDWGSQASKVTKAWRLFRKAYEHYPATHLFGYYGPVQDGLVWPLHLVPRNRPLSPTWKLDYPPSGDYLADCLSSDFTLDEVTSLCRRMADLWQEGLVVLDQAFAKAQKTRVQAVEWRVAHAIGLQFESAAEILRFYQLREVLADSEGKRASMLLDEMEELIGGEIARRRAMMDLCDEEPTLGFHSEAEGFKFTPALLARGVRDLERLLSREFPAVRRELAMKSPPFPHYTGASASRVLCFQTSSAKAGSLKRHALRSFLVQNSSINSRPLASTSWRRAAMSDSPITAHFQACASPESLLFHISVESLKDMALDSWISAVIVDVVPGRLHPRVQFQGDSRGYKTPLVDDGYLMKEPLAFEWSWHRESRGWRAEMAIPLASARLEKATGMFRFNLRVTCFNPTTNERWELSWKLRKPLKARQAWDDANPASDYGWARIDG